MDIAERRRPQDGRIKINVGKKTLDLRVSVLPTNHGQSVVMRLLDKDKHPEWGFDSSGLADSDFRLVPESYPTAERNRPGDRSDRLRQDHNPIRGAQ